MANLLELFDNVVEFQNYNGVPLAAGKLYVYALGRTRLMDTWSDIDGESLNPNPIILDDLGQCHCYVSDAFDYTLVVCDQFDNEIFSVDKYLLSKGEHSHADVAVAPSEHIGVSSYHIGEVTVYVPYLTGEVGKTYEGILPIVVNNDVNRISANHIPLGVQDPLYFVEDSETACILGCSAQTEIPAELSGKWDEASDAVIANSAQWAEGIEYEAGSYIDIDGHTISVTGLQPEGDYAYNSALSSKLDVTALPQDLVHSGDLTAYYPIDNPSGFITGVDLSDYATNEDLQTVSADITAMIPTALTGDYLTKESADTLYQPIGNYLSSTDSANFLLTSDSGNFYTTDNPSGFITGVDIPESANWNSTYNTVHDNSAIWTGSTANPQIPVTGINGIKISESGDKVVFEVSGDYYPGNNPSGFITGVDLSDYATTAQVSEKLDTTAFSDVSGTFLTAHQDLSDYQTTAGMTAYMSTADSANFYTTANESGFITSGELPDPITIGVQEGDTLDTDYDGLKIVKSTANGNEHINLHKKSTDQWLIHGNLVPTSPGSNKYLITDDSGAMHWDNKSALAYDSAFEQSGGYITAYNGSAFKAGDELPSGVMNESALEYNAVNEISGYNGSAIAQYGAEKQWLQHDDTLVHAANSAQYALGVNLSAVAQLLGVDETVLYEGNGTGASACTFTESLLNFTEISITVGNAAGSEGLYFIRMPAKEFNQLHLTYNAGGGGNEYFVGCYGSMTSAGISLTKCVAIRAGYTNGTPASTIDNNSVYMPCIHKVVGIGRKEV